jgi:hypothetical protein
MPRLARIELFPFKSLDGISVSRATVLPSGALAHDRRFALVDADGRVVNGKRTASIHNIRAWHDLERMSSRFAQPRHDPLDWTWGDPAGSLEAWFSAALGGPVRLVEDVVRGFPDDLEANGPTLVSTGTLAAVAGWFPGLDSESVRRRFRANLEFDAVVPFWEDRLFGPPGSSPVVRIESVPLVAVNPCQRCVVPSRDPESGAVTSGFVARFRSFRESSLPPGVHRARFDHFYRLAVNTRPLAPFAGGELCVGNRLLTDDAASA